MRGGPRFMLLSHSEERTMGVHTEHGVQRGIPISSNQSIYTLFLAEK